MVVVAAVAGFAALWIAGGRWYIRWWCSGDGDGGGCGGDGDGFDD